MGKLTYLLNADHNISLSVTGTPSSSGGKIGGKDTLATDPQTGNLPSSIAGNPDSPVWYNQQLASTTSTAFKYSGAFNEKKLLLDANLGWFHQTAALLPEDGSTPGSNKNQAGLSEVIYYADRPVYYYEPGLANARTACAKFDQNERIGPMDLGRSKSKANVSRSLGAASGSAPGVSVAATTGVGR